MSTVALISAIVHVLGRLYTDLSGLAVPMFAVALAAIAFKVTALDGSSSGRAWPIAVAVLSLACTLASLPYEPQ